MKTRKIPIGISDFKKLIEEQYYFIDKSRIIQEVLDRPAEVLLLPRPRRFGKTLNLSMLRYFFERAEASQAHLFDGLAIANDPDSMAHQGQYPVIFLTFKDVKTADFATCLRQIHQVITTEYGRQMVTAPPVQTEFEQQQWQSVMVGQADQATLMNALSLLMSVLHRASQKKVIVLIDEYDAPIHAGYQYGYYDEIVLFMRNLFSAAFKDNADLEKGVLTGILRIARESIFSGLNNIDVYTVLRQEFQDRFGFTGAEVAQLATDFKVQEPEVISRWYNGYLFGNAVIYNPWSVLNFLDSLDRRFRPYWINTSSNDLIRDLILDSSPELHTQVERLLAGEPVRCALNENIALRDLRDTPETVMNLLVFSGYLTPIRMIDDPLYQMYDLGIPNQEVRFFFEDSVRTWLTRQTGSQRLTSLLRALTMRDVKTFGKILQDIVVAVLSYHDTGGDEPERVYHAFVLGLLVHLQDRYTIRSNRESGYGRYDVLLIPHDVNAPGFVFEFKKIDRDDDKTPEAALHSALQQIQDKQYAAELRASGVQNITGIGVVVEGKRIWVESVEL